MSIAEKNEEEKKHTESLFNKKISHYDFDKSAEGGGGAEAVYGGGTDSYAGG